MGEALVARAASLTWMNFCPFNSFGVAVTVMIISIGVINFLCVYLPMSK